jgi:hypothetical protein
MHVNSDGPHIGIRRCAASGDGPRQKVAVLRSCRSYEVARREVTLEGCLISATSRRTASSSWTNRSTVHSAVSDGRSERPQPS